jgi:hypothetical protein
LCGTDDLGELATILDGHPERLDAMRELFGKR